MSQDAYPGNPLNPQSLNQYAYVMNNPVNMWDPTGNIPSWVGQSSYKEYETLLGDEYLMEEYNITSSTSSTGWKQISYTKELKRYVYKYRNRVTTHWRYEHIHHRWQLVPDPVTGKVGGAVEIGTTTETAHYEVIDYYYKTVIKSALDIAMENQIEVDKRIREALEGQNIPKNEDPTISISRLDGQVIDGEDVILNQDSTTEEDRLVLSHVKSQLNEILGTNVNPNGSYNGTTTGFVKNFQEANDLLPTGVIDKKTFLQIDKAYDYLSMSDDTRQVAAPEAIERNSGIDTIIPIPKDASDILKAQIYLATMGFDIGKDANGGPLFDGLAGRPYQSWQAIKAFQDMVGLEPTGIINEGTLNKMKAAVDEGWTITDNILKLNKNLVQKDKYGYIKPVYGGNITSPYGERYDPFEKDEEGNPVRKFHGGTDIGGESGSLENMPLYASDDGFIVFVRRDNGDGVGNYVILQGDQGMSFRYMHMNGFSEELEKKSPITKNELKIEVKKGDFIGYVGNTGIRSTGAHLHLEMWDNIFGANYNDYIGERENPEIYMDLRN